MASPLVTPSGGLLLLLLLHLLIFDNCHETAVPAIHSLHQAMRRTTIGSFERSWENFLSCHTFRRSSPPPPLSAHFWQLSWDCSCLPFSSSSNEENHHWLTWEIMRELPMLTIVMGISPWLLSFQSCTERNPQRSTSYHLMRELHPSKQFLALHTIVWYKRAHRSFSLYLLKPPPWQCPSLLDTYNIFLHKY